MNIRVNTMNISLISMNIRELHEYEDFVVSMNIRLIFMNVSLIFMNITP